MDNRVEIRRNEFAPKQIRISFKMIIKFIVSFLPFASIRCCGHCGKRSRPDEDKSIQQY